MQTCKRKSLISIITVDIELGVRGHFKGKKKSFLIPIHSECLSPQDILPSFIASSSL